MVRSSASGCSARARARRLGVGLQLVRREKRWLLAVGRWPFTGATYNEPDGGRDAVPSPRPSGHPLPRRGGGSLWRCTLARPFGPPSPALRERDAVALYPHPAFGHPLPRRGRGTLTGHHSLLLPPQREKVPRSGG